LADPQKGKLHIKSKKIVGSCELTITREKNVIPEPTIKSNTTSKRSKMISPGSRQQLSQFIDVLHVLDPLIIGLSHVVQILHNNTQIYTQYQAAASWRKTKSCNFATSKMGAYFQQSYDIAHF